MAGIMNPFLRGQFAAAEDTRQSDQANLTGLATLLKLQQAQQEQPVRMDLLRAQTANEQAKPEDRRNAQETTRQMGLARLQQAAGQFEQTMQLKLRNATTAEERNAITQEYNRGRLALEGAAREQGDYKLFYDTGMTRPGVQVPGVTAAAPAGPAPAQPQGLEALLPGRPAADVQASINSLFPLTSQAAAAAEGADIRRRELLPNGGGMLPSSLVLGQNAPAATVAPPGATVAPLPVSPSGAPMPQATKVRDQMLAKNVDLSTPEAQKSVEYWSEVLQKGGSMPPGLARTPEGAALVKEVMKRVGGGETAPIDLMSRQAEFMGEKAGQRTLGTRTANIEMAATEAAGLSRLALQASEEWNRTGLKTLNDVEKYAQSKTASPELRRFVAANTSFINAYARAINPQGVGTVADKEHAREMLEVGFSKGDYAAAINQLQAEIRTAQQAPGQVKDAMRSRFTGREEGATPAPAGKTRSGATVSNW